MASSSTGSSRSVDLSPLVGAVRSPRDESVSPSLAAGGSEATRGDRPATDARLTKIKDLARKLDDRFAGARGSAAATPFRVEQKFDAIAGEYTIKGNVAEVEIDGLKLRIDSNGSIAEITKDEEGDEIKSSSRRFAFSRETNALSLVVETEEKSGTVTNYHPLKVNLPGGRVGALTVPVSNSYTKLTAAARDLHHYDQQKLGNSDIGPGTSFYVNIKNADGKTFTREEVSISKKGVIHGPTTLQFKKDKVDGQVYLVYENGEKAQVFETEDPTEEATTFTVETPTTEEKTDAILELMKSFSQDQLDQMIDDAGPRSFFSVYGVGEENNIVRAALEIKTSARDLKQRGGSLFGMSDARWNRFLIAPVAVAHQRTPQQKRDGISSLYAQNPWIAAASAKENHLAALADVVNNQWQATVATADNLGIGAMKACLALKNIGGGVGRVIAPLAELLGGIARGVVTVSAIALGITAMVVNDLVLSLAGGIFLAGLFVAYLASKYFIAPAVLTLVGVTVGLVFDLIIRQGGGWLLYGLGEAHKFVTGTRELHEDYNKRKVSDDARIGDKLITVVDTRSKDDQNAEFVQDLFYASSPIIELARRLFEGEINSLAEAKTPVKPLPMGLKAGQYVNISEKIAQAREEMEGKIASINEEKLRLLAELPLGAPEARDIEKDADDKIAAVRAEAGQLAEALRDISMRGANPRIIGDRSRRRDDDLAALREIANPITASTLETDSDDEGHGSSLRRAALGRRRALGKHSYAPTLPGGSAELGGVPRRRRAEAMRPGLSTTGVGAASLLASRLRTDSGAE